MDLSNLKAGQTATDGELSVTKQHGMYEVSLAGVASGTLTYERPTKRWLLASGGQVHQLEGVTAKTVTDAVVRLWLDQAVAEAASQATEPEPAPEPEATPAPEPTETDEDVKARKLNQVLAALKLAQDERGDDGQTETALAMVAKLMAKYSISEEELRRAQAAERGEEAEPEGIEAWQYPVNVQGGHGPHRVAAFASVASAMGAGVFYTHRKRKGQGYKADEITLHVIAQPSVIANIKRFLPVVELQMERLGEKVSKEVSRRSREAGGHHSGPGCHARRGFMRGFGVGIADRIRQDTRVAEGDTSSTALVVRDRASEVDSYMKANHANLRSTKAQKYDHSAWVAGHNAGVAFASPAISEEPASRQLQHA